MHSTLHSTRGAGGEERPPEGRHCWHLKVLCLPTVQHDDHGCQQAYFKLGSALHCSTFSTGAIAESWPVSACTALPCTGLASTGGRTPAHLDDCLQLLQPLLHVLRGVQRLLSNPVPVPRQCPAGDGPAQTGRESEHMDSCLSFSPPPAPRPPVLPCCLQLCMQRSRHCLVHGML